MLGDIIWQVWLPIIAFTLDMFLGHRSFWWRHPVCYVGNLIDFFERIGRSLGSYIGNVRIAGAICVLLIVSIVGIVVWWLCNLPYLGIVFTLYFAYTGLATKSLLIFFEEVLKSIEHDNIDDARKAVAQLVSRDTTILDQNELRKTLADTFSENYTDAVLAPLFWLLIGGPVGLWMYKAVSTMDSMWGYKSEPWLELGFAAAKADDILAYIPARLSVPMLQCANEYENIVKKTGGRWPGWKCIFKQAKGMPSPNSGLPMAASAWLMNARMAGPSVYFGEMVHKPWLGPPEEEAKPWDEQRLKHLGTIVKVASYMAIYILPASLLGIYMMIGQFL